MAGDTIIYDAVDDIICAIKTQWKGGATLRIEPVWEVKAVGFGSSRQEVMYVTPMTENIKPFDLFGKAYWQELPIKLDVRTYRNIKRHKEVVKELHRIIKNIIRRDADGFLQVVLKSSEPVNTEIRNMFRQVITLHYISVETFTFT